MGLFFYLVEYFLPASMRDSSTDLLRGYVLVGLTLTNVIISALVTLGLIFLLDLGDRTLLGVALNTTCVVGYLVALAVLKRTENYKLCANILLGTLATVIFGSVQITGGYSESPIPQLILQLPVTAFLLLGLNAGLVWAGITMLLGGVLYSSTLLNFGYVQLLPDTSVIEPFSIMLQFVLLTIVGGALTIYEIMNSILTRSLDEERSRFEHKASHDDLTGIPNRFEFFRRIQTAIGEAREREHKVGVVYIDLDGFKPVNDLLGHHIGDEALRAVASRLQRVLRLSDTTARLGGDEFALILPGIHVPTDVEIILPKILEAIREPIRIENLDVVVRASCGVAIYPDHSDDHAALCRFADKAMYHAKEQTDSYLVYHPDLPPIAEVRA
ncbi:MAG: GGDEF domain-containing protein [Halioglobus sp.]|nr:GGDEF domain-containing protein [Halioglobus sp.]